MGVFSVSLTPPNPQKKEKAGHKPNSVKPWGSPIIYLDQKLPLGSIRLPFSLGVQPSDADIHGVSPHRVYLISLQPYLYILSVALVLPVTRETGVTRYAALRCSDFPPRFPEAIG